MENWRVTSDYFFATKNSGSLSKTTVAKVFRDTNQALEWNKNVTAHILRHSFASKLVKNDVHLVKISKLLGHSSLKTTSIYVHSNMDDLKDAVNTL
jgi:site-specific recombinase XerD